MHVYELFPGINKFILVTSENNKMKLVTSLKWLYTVYEKDFFKSELENFINFEENYAFWQNKCFISN